MIEVSDPETLAHDASTALGLPLAWSLLNTQNYTSIGINFDEAHIVASDRN